ncbi:F-box/WD-40 repeat-containing protein At3g52030 isoform X2 [Mercurialis annua]|uniref:F-box/WD-40 repeat-containing protein At3g52030 isoform X2 n=1 Tax=Mercurialis annua TaxID=3986 RepID=UPI00215E1ACB|nr:F-box/WD-40 repeat-containing protein At3g52030 isoform X2 [Mercurialis annua]
MNPTQSYKNRSPPANTKRTSRFRPTTIHLLENDILCIIFSFLDFFDLVRCSVVCTSWNALIKNSKLLQLLYLKQHQLESNGINNGELEETISGFIEELAMKHHKEALVEPDFVYIDKWKGHSLGIDQCRMKMGLLLTGVGDKVIRMWSIESYKCVEEYSIPNAFSLADFDFDESKIVGLIGTRLCLWRRNGKTSTFLLHEGTHTKGLCMRYSDPEAVIGCDDGTAHVFDMYSKKCSNIIRMHNEPVTCLALGDDQLILGGSSLGRITVSDYSCDQIATLKPTDSLGIKTLCFDPRTYQVFAGTAGGYASCWDLRMMRRLWQTRVSPNVIYSLQHLSTDKSTLVAGGIDGVLRILDRNNGDVLTSYIIDQDAASSSSGYAHGAIERRIGVKLLSETDIDQIPRSFRPSITCLAVGMKKVVTTHNSNYIRVWKFKK